MNTEPQSQSIERAPVEPVLPDVPTAQRLALAARTEREQAEYAITKAKTARDSAKAEYIASPTPEGDEECDRTEAAVRRSERYAEAMFAKLNAAEKALSDAKRADAWEALDEAGDERDRIRRKLAEHFHALRNLNAHAGQQIAMIEALVSQDSIVCEAATKSARAAGIGGAARPVDVNLVRHAIGVMLAGSRPRPSNHISSDQARSMMTALAQMMVRHDDNGGLTFDVRLTPDERAGVLRAALDEYAIAIGAPDVTDWIVPRFPPPQALAHTPAGARHHQARALFLAILQSENGEKQ
jgi:hypothetical protein